MPRIFKTSRHNRFSNPTYQKNEYSSFNFGKSLKSYKDDVLFFTNFVKSKNNECYKKIEEYLSMCTNGDYSFLEKDFFPLDDIKYTEPSAKRLLDIFNKGYQHKYKAYDLKRIFELKSRLNKKFHFFIIQNETSLEVILIDFFHLGLNGDLIVNGNRKKISNEQIFKKECNNEWNLSNLKDNP